MTHLPYWKIASTIGGAALTGAAVALNAQHIAAAEGWESPLVLAGIIVTVCAALTPPAAERCQKEGQPLKAAMLWLFFTLAVAFSLSASIGRAGDHRDAQVADGEAANMRAEVAQEAYAAAKKTAAEECAKRGSLCRKAEAALAMARGQLGAAPAAKAADPGAERIASVLGISQASVALYSPLALPFALELGGFIFLAVGLAPRRKIELLRHDRKDDDGTPVVAVARPQAIASRAVAIAKPVARPAMAALPAPAKPGTKAYYLQRLEREFPKLANAVAEGSLSVFAATLAAGLRKGPALQYA
jgi:hypothetical protein